MNTLDIFKISSACNFFIPDISDFFITDFGYNDFRILKGSKASRKQTNCTLHYVIGGNGTLCYKNKSHNIGTGDIFLLPPNEEFSYFPDENKPWRYCWFGFSGKEAEKIVNEEYKMYNSSVINGISEEKVFSALIDSLYILSENKNIGYYKTVSAFFSLLDVIEFKTYEYDNDKFLSDLISNIKLNAYNAEITIEDICHMTHVSHSYLCRIFKDNLKISIKQYITNIRMVKAMSIIKKENCKISEIAEKSGYKDEINFMKAFKKYYGNPISHYRKQ